MGVSRPADLFEVGHRGAAESALLVGLVVAHPPERRRIAVDRGRRRPARVPEAVNVRGVEVESLAGGALAARVGEAVLPVMEAVLDEDALADVDAARGEVVIVV